MAAEAKPFAKRPEIKKQFEAQHAEIHEVIQAYVDANPHMKEEDMIKVGIPLPKRLKQAEKSWQHMNVKNMRNEEVLSTNMALVKPPPQFRAGQPIHYYWASWMDGATEPLLGIKKGSRAKWYRGEISNAPKWDTISYAGMKSTCWTYLAH